MAAERVIITCLSILLLFAALISLAQSSQDGIPAAPNHKSKIGQSGKLLLNGGDEDAASVTSAANKKWSSGRKMVQMKKLKDVKVSGGATGLGGSASELSKCGSNGNGDLGCEQVTVNFSDEADDHHRSGFVAFNADYHAPRHHPPKNN